MTDSYANGKDDPALSEMCWPCPGERLAEINDRLRFAPDHLTTEDRLVAASVIGAYCELINGTNQQRGIVLSALRRVVRKRKACK